MVTLEELQTVAKERRLESLQILREDFHVTPSELIPVVYNYNPVLCRFYFSELLGEPFDFHNEEHVIRLVEQMKTSYMTRAKLLYFFMTTYHRIITASSQKQVTSKSHASKQSQRIKESVNKLEIPNLCSVKPNKHNPFRKGSLTQILFEYLLQYTGTPKEWPQYIQKALTEQIAPNHKKEIKTSSYILENQMKKRLQKKGITITKNEKRIFVLKGRKVIGNA